MTATIVNALAVLLGGSIGLMIKRFAARNETDVKKNAISDNADGTAVCKKKSKQKNKKHFSFVNSQITVALGLCVCVIGFSGSLKGDMMLLIVSLALGTFCGELLDIDGKLKSFGDFLQSLTIPRVNLEGKISEKSNFTQGFVTTSLIFCVGAMSVTGSLDAGLRHDYSTIFTKSLLDGISSVIFASTLGVGVLFSVLVILVYQGGIELSAGLLSGILSDGLITQISAAGSVMIFALGLNMVAKTEIRTANLLPGLIFAGFYYQFIICN